MRLYRLTMRKVCGDLIISDRILALLLITVLLLAIKIYRERVNHDDK